MSGIPFPPLIRAAVWSTLGQIRAAVLHTADKPDSGIGRLPADCGLGRVDVDYCVWGRDWAN